MAVGQFEEARSAFAAYLKQHPADSSAVCGQFKTMRAIYERKSNPSEKKRILEDARHFQESVQEMNVMTNCEIIQLWPELSKKA